MRIRELLTPLLRKVGLLLLGLGVALAILLFFYQYSERSRASIEYPVGVFFSPDKIESEPNKEVYVDIQASTPQPISIATILITFPKKILTYEKEKTLAHSDSPCGQFEKGIDSRVIPKDENYDIIILTRGTEKSNADLPRNVFCFGRVFFTTKVDGTGTIDFSTQPSGNWKFDIAGPSGSYIEAFDSGMQQVSVLVQTPGTPSPTASIAPTNTLAPGVPTNTQTPSDNQDITIKLRVRLQGVITQPRIMTPITLRAKLLEGSATTGEYQQIVLSPQSDGTYLGNHTYKNLNIQSKYALLVKGPKHLQKKICVSSPTETTGGTYTCATPNITFTPGENTIELKDILHLSGDLPLQDGLIDSVDITYIRSNLGSTVGNTLERGDLNYDGIIDTQDFTLIINALKFKYDE